MKQRIFLLLTMFLFAFWGSFAQDGNRDLLIPINALFDGMKKGDSALAHSAFQGQPKIFIATKDGKTGQPVLLERPLSGFLKSIGSPHPEVWSELFWSPKIEVDGNLAQVWTPYVFYLDKTFSHCGIDVFQLFKDAKGQWKIFSLSYNTQKEGCDIPAEIKEKMK